MHICKFCGKSYSSLKGVNAHQPLCKQNPNGKSPSSWATGNRKGVQSWNAGLIGDERCKHSESTKEKLSIATSSRTKEFNKNIGNIISKTIKKRVAEGTWHTSLAKHMHIDYNGADLHGSWEVAYAKYLASNLIKWVRNKDSFSYEFEGKMRKYTPDFYLIESDEYIEIKGYKTEKDSAKWSQFPSHRKLKVLMKDDLKKLGII